ncbi:hypothetical protein F5Y11DRAFT_230581 [Daldinia sp. FL1419]|nr:hypothetical protein F5Y11DRAFT_230581 [Daldinia sp. FL1419]
MTSALFFSWTYLSQVRLVGWFGIASPCIPNSPGRLGLAAYRGLIFFLPEGEKKERKKRKKKKGEGCFNLSWLATDIMQV